MPNLNTFSTLHERVKKCRADYSLEDNSSAFMWLALETILQLNSDDIEDAITDGGQDGGVDAIHIADRTVSLFTFKYTESFDNCSKNFPEKDLDSFVLTAQGICQKSLQQDVVNQVILGEGERDLVAFSERASLLQVLCLLKQTSAG